MNRLLNLMKASSRVFLICILTVQPGLAFQATAALKGQVVDQLGGVIVGATVKLIDAKGAELTTVSDEQGMYNFKNVSPGMYTLEVTVDGFSPYKNLKVALETSQSQSIEIKLEAAIVSQQVNVSTSPAATDPNSNASAVVLKGNDLDILPDSPDQLEDVLQALAGPSAGPNGSQISVDGFTAGDQLPPRTSIQEVRINQNPFSAENDRLGFGNIQIITKAGTSEFHGQANIYTSNGKLNSRNPYATVRPPFNSRYYGGLLSGPLVTKGASFLFRFQRHEIDQASVVSATVLSPSFDIQPFSDVVRSARRENSYSPRVDYQINNNNTFTGQYLYIGANYTNQDVGGLTLSSSGYGSKATGHAVKLTETAIVNPSIVNEVGLQYERETASTIGNTAEPTINVLDAFVGGGAPFIQSSNKSGRLEIRDTITWVLGNHTLRMGGRLRRANITDISTSNFLGTFTFAGGSAPRLDGNGNIITDATGNPIVDPITSIERYRRTLLFADRGLSPSAIRVLGGGATQFSVAGGQPAAHITQTDIGAFLQDDWKLRPNFTLSLGLRYEGQTNIDSRLDLAPRVAFAWAPASSGAKAKTVIRGGFGIFYDRFSEELTLRAKRFNGINQQQYIITGNDLLDLFPQAPSADLLSGFALPQSLWTVDQGLRSPYSAQAALSVERALPSNFMLTTGYIYTRVLHVLRTRNINAPLPGTHVPGDPLSGIRPLEGASDIFQYESSGIFKQHQLIVNLTNRANRYLSLFATYAYNFANSDTDGVGTFAADTFDLRDEYGRSSLDVRQRLNVGGTITLPAKFTLNPLIVIRSGIPFNITTGRDINGDTLFTERPAFATDLDKPGVIITRLGAFDPNPAPGQKTISRNFGTGASFFGMNLRLSKSFAFGFGSKPATPSNLQAQGDAPKPYKLTVSIQAFNLFNHTNPGSPIGNLTSPLFGVSNATAAELGFRNAASNRRIWMSAVFSF